MSSRTQIAQALAGSPPQFLNPSQFDSQGLQQPPEVTQALLAMLTPGLATAARGIAPEASAPELLPAIAKGAKTGDPHALFAYHDNFGPGMTKRALYNVFGDVSHPAVKAAGWGSSLPIEALKKFGIPITGKQL